jgi:hypothetical protein
VNQAQKRVNAVISEAKRLMRHRHLTAQQVATARQLPTWGRRLEYLRGAIVASEMEFNARIAAARDFYKELMACWEEMDEEETV